MREQAGTFTSLARCGGSPWLLHMCTIRIHAFALVTALVLDMNLSSEVVMLRSFAYELGLQALVFAFANITGKYNI